MGMRCKDNKQLPFGCKSNIFLCIICKILNKIEQTINKAEGKVN